MYHIFTVYVRTRHTYTLTGRAEEYNNVAVVLSHASCLQPCPLHARHGARLNKEAMLLAWAGIKLLHDVRACMLASNCYMTSAVPHALAPEVQSEVQRSRRALHLSLRGPVPRSMALSEL